MGFHAIAEYIKYLQKAKGRHGVHSPFIYGFIETCLRQKEGALINRIEKFIAPGNIFNIDSELKLWMQEKETCLAEMKNDDCIIISHIHQTKYHTAMWEQLIENTQVLLSIDIYSAGLLFVKKEFKEKQHFIVK